MGGVGRAQVTLRLSTRASRSASARERGPGTSQRIAGSCCPASDTARQCRTRAAGAARSRCTLRRGVEIAYVALGSNLGAREQHLSSALAALRATPGIRDLAVSQVYETRPWVPARRAAT